MPLDKAKGCAMRRRLSALPVILAAVFAIMGAPVTPASAAGPVFPVMNTSETLPDGVYFRNSPHTADHPTIYGFGVFRGEHVQAQCWQMGDAVGKYNNHMWYFALNTDRRSVAGRTNQGWINTHYVDDGMTADHAAPGVPQCGSTPAPPPSVRAVYYSPSAGENQPAGGAAVKTVGTSQWAPGNCNTTRAIGYVPSSAHTLAGWSLGRLGPVYALARASSGQKQQISYILMIDPGGYNQLRTGCDNTPLGTNSGNRTAGQILAGWLRDNPSARLVIMAGDVTADPRHPVNGHAHAGIQNFYFNDVRAAGASARSRTLVCNYSVPGTNVGDNGSLQHSHHVMYQQINRYINASPITSCPSVSGLNQGASWHP